ncbi:hypothetical protein BV20DRAFT_934734 [Pilatotrama ljubarskyi]|nr:hypothetical protein BV20DRAFT_934734 [Pilatotrama ljubarskyi]
MSTPLDLAQASAEYWYVSVRFNNSLALVAFTLLYYDYVLTVFSEIQYFWRSANMSIISFLFVVNRYLGLLGPIPIAVEYFGDSSEKVKYSETFQLMLVIRTYALYDRSKRILILLIVTHLAGALMCLVAIVTTTSPVKTSTPLPFTYKGCDLSLTNDQYVSAPDLTLAWGAMLWFDTTIFVLTLVQALRMRRHFPGGLLEIMFRDGSFSILRIMLAANVSNIITFMVSHPFSGSPLKGMDTTLTNVLSTTLTSRLILNLRNPKLQQSRQVEENDLTSAWNTTTAAPTPRTMTFDCALSEVVAVSVDTRMTEVEIV